MRVLLVMATLLLCRPARAEPPAALAGLRRETLDNGLTVLVLEDHRAPLVSLGAMYAVGARNEAAGQTGIAHFVEHMNFRATARFPGSESTESITRIGGRWSGYTWIDQTYYGATVPREALGLLLDIEADRMTAARFAPDEFDRERASVVAELHSYDDPHSLLYDAVLAASFELHPYRHNTIGWLTDVEQITRDEAWRFYGRFYHPGNTVLAVRRRGNGASPCRVRDRTRRCWWPGARRRCATPTSRPWWSSTRCWPAARASSSRANTPHPRARRWRARGRRRGPRVPPPTGSPRVIRTSTRCSR
jgi:hypothetical protein